MSNKTNFIIRYLFVVLLGVFLHFAYELSGKNTIVGLFTPINESTWEHLKLLFTPMLLLTIWDSSTDTSKKPRFLPARVFGILMGLLFITIAFYTINGILGKTVDWINIVIFLLGVLLAFWAENRFLYYNKYGSRLLNTTSAILLLIALSILFVVFTITPPDIGIFRIP